MATTTLSQSKTTLLTSNVNLYAAKAAKESAYLQSNLSLNELTRLTGILTVAQAALSSNTDSSLTASLSADVTDAQLAVDTANTAKTTAQSNVTTAEAAVTTAASAVTDADTAYVNALNAATLIELKSNMDADLVALATASAAHLAADNAYNVSSNELIRLTGILNTAQAAYDGRDSTDLVETAKLLVVLTAANTAASAAEAANATALATLENKTVLKNDANSMYIMGKRVYNIAEFAARPNSTLDEIKTASDELILETINKKAVEDARGVLDNANLVHIDAYEAYNVSSALVMREQLSYDTAKLRGKEFNAQVQLATNLVAQAQIKVDLYDTQIYKNELAEYKDDLAYCILKLTGANSTERTLEGQLAMAMIEKNEDLITLTTANADLESKQQLYNVAVQKLSTKDHLELTQFIQNEFVSNSTIGLNLITTATTSFISTEASFNAFKKLLDDSKILQVNNDFFNNSSSKFNQYEQRSDVDINVFTQYNNKKTEYTTKLLSAFDDRKGPLEQWLSNFASYNIVKDELNKAISASSINGVTLLNLQNYIKRYRSTIDKLNETVRNTLDARRQIIEDIRNIDLKMKALLDSQATQITMFLQKNFPSVSLSAFKDALMTEDNLEKIVNVLNKVIVLTDDFIVLVTAAGTDNDEFPPLKTIYDALIEASFIKQPTIIALTTKMTAMDTQVQTILLDGKHTADKTLNYVKNIDITKALPTLTGVNVFNSRANAINNVDNDYINSIKNDLTVAKMGDYTTLNGQLIILSDILAALKNYYIDTTDVFTNYSSNDKKSYFDFIESAKIFGTFSETVTTKITECKNKNYYLTIRNSSFNLVNEKIINTLQSQVVAKINKTYTNYNLTMSQSLFAYIEANKDIKYLYDSYFAIPNVLNRNLDQAIQDFIAAIKNSKDSRLIEFYNTISTKVITMLEDVSTTAFAEINSLIVQNSLKCDAEDFISSRYEAVVAKKAEIALIKSTFTTMQCIKFPNNMVGATTAPSKNSLGQPNPKNSIGLYISDSDALLFTTLDDFNFTTGTGTIRLSNLIRRITDLEKLMTSFKLIDTSHSTI